MPYEPPVTITNRMLNSVSAISRLVGRVSAYDRLSPNLRLRRISRMRTIHSSLAIEANTLSLEQVTAVIDGKRVLAPPEDIREAQNAYAAYEALAEMDPYSMEDLLRAHKYMMEGLVKDAGCFRSSNVGVFDGDVLVHAGTPAKYVPEVMRGLFDWLKTTDMHPLIASCVFHYEFEFIHPFSDGNGRMGRLWHSLLLRNWEDVFSWLPIESLVAEHQQEYYAALGGANASGGVSTPFVEFMLSMIEQTLAEAVSVQEQGLPTSDPATFGPPRTPQVPPKHAEEVAALVSALAGGELSARELMLHLGLSDMKHFRAAYLNPALDAGAIERTLPAKPTSPKQKYRASR